VIARRLVAAGLSFVLVASAATALVLGQLRSHLLSVDGLMAYIERDHAVDWLRDAAAEVAVERAFQWARDDAQPEASADVGGEDGAGEGEVAEEGAAAAEDALAQEALKQRARAELQPLFARLFPRPWLEERLRRVLGVSWPFLAGEAGAFGLRLDVTPDDARTQAALLEVLPQSALLAQLYDQLIDQAADRIMSMHLNWPLGWEVSRAELLAMLRDLLPRQWVAARLADAASHLVAFMRGTRPDFTLLLPLHERDENLGLQLRAAALRANTYDFLINHFIHPAVRQALEGERLALPWGLSLSEEDVVSAFVEVLPEDWLTVQKLNIAEQVALYLLGDKAGLRIDVPIAQRKPAASAVLARLIVGKLHAQIPTLPLCTSADAFRAQLDEMDSPLRCRLGGVRGGGALLMLDLHVSSRIQQLIERKLPDRWSYTEANLQGDLSPETWAWVQSVRAALSGGLVITDQDLRDQLSPSQRRYFDRALEISRDGLQLNSDMLERACTPGRDCGWRRLGRVLVALRLGVWVSTLAGGVAVLGLLGWSIRRRPRPPLSPPAAAVAVGRWAPRILGALSLLVLLGAWWLDLTLSAALASLSRAWPWPQLAPGLPAMLNTMRAETIMPLYATSALLIALALLLSLALTWRSPSPRPEA
jgi:hypothetical protein